MHRAIAAWLTEHPWRAVIAIAFCGALSQLMLPFTVLACAIPVLTVMRFDAKLGFAAAAVGAGTACFLYPTAHAGTSQASQAFWDVADVDREITALKSRGVVFEEYDMPGERSPAGAVIAGGAKAAWFKDSEGNIMALVQTLSAARGSGG